MLAAGEDIALEVAAGEPPLKLRQKGPELVAVGMEAVDVIGEIRVAGKLRGEDAVTVCFFGDGACEQGTFHESANLAAIWNLPVIFVAENNGYAQSTPASYHCAIENIAERAAGYGIPGAVVDGSDVFAVHEAAVEAVKRARAGQGPSLLECKTYRHHGHFEGDQQTYKDDLYRSGSHGKDSIRDFRALVTQHGWFTSEELDAIDVEARQAVDEALAYAESSPLPQVEEVTSDVYVSYP